MATPHIAAEKGDFAPTVLMPGDPLRARFVAENFLERARLVNDVRGVQGYTGEYKGKPVSVMASGMGMPSMGIYSYELFHFFDVRSIIRIGSAGAISPDLRPRDIVLAMGACTDSRYGAQFSLPGTFAPVASWDLLERAVRAAERAEVSFKVGNVLSSDRFYDDSASTLAWGKMGVLAVEMESAALYMNAARAGREALTVLTVSDSLVTGEALSAAERQTGFSEMIKLALDMI